MDINIELIKKSAVKYLNLSREYVLNHKKNAVIIGGAIVIVLLYGLSRITEPKIKHYQINQQQTQFNNGKMFLSHNSQAISNGKNKAINNKINKVKNDQASLFEQLKLMDQKFAALESKNTELQKKLNEKEEQVVTQIDGQQPPIEQDTAVVIDEVAVAQSATRLMPSTSPPLVYKSSFRKELTKKKRQRRKLITFPVKSTRQLKEDSIVLPTGSYVKAKLLTGIEAPEGKTYPVLAELDYAYITPNDKRIDLAGCFMILKAQGDLSTERVQMQADKISCVSKSGKMFEREINGFIADDKDNSFAVIGTVHSKQDRVAAMAFLSSVVEGVSKAIQQAQTTQTTNAVGGSQSVLTGDQSKYIVGGGVGNAASRVTDWYLKQAENLLPTINIGSGQDVYVVMGSTVELPREYFQQPRRNTDETIYSFYSNVLN